MKLHGFWGILSHSLLWAGIATAIWNENCNCIAFQLHALSAASTGLVSEDLNTDLIDQVKRIQVVFLYMEDKLKGRLEIIKNATEA